MTTELSTEEILEYAISLERRSVALYTDLASTARNDAMRKVFLGFAEEEMGHRKKLEDVLDGELKLGTDVEVADMKISDYAVAVALDTSSSYQDILLFAMQQEQQAYRLYTDLSQRVSEPQFKALFVALAREEVKHRNRFELEYDEHVLTEN